MCIRFSFLNMKIKNYHLWSNNRPIFNKDWLRPFYKTIKKNSNTLHYKYSSEIEAAVNKQIQIEQQAAQDYLGLAVIYLHRQHLRQGSGNFFMKMHEEELKHMQHFIRYQLKRGGMPIINSITAPSLKINMSLLDAFKQALDMEKKVAQSLENLVNIAEKEKDPQCADFVTAEFLKEQINSIDEITQHVVNLTRLGEEEHALYHYDLQI